MFSFLVYVVAFVHGVSSTIEYEATTVEKETFPEMVAAAGYPVENHYVTTYDGYILNVHRIPHGTTGSKLNKVAYLQHGLLTSSTDWIIMGPQKSLAYILADEGYDVWLGNARGNVYSRNHSTLNPDVDAKFWQFSWHEIGVTDVSTTIDYVLQQTGSDGVYYAGHSQGTTAYYVLTSTRPEYNDKIKAHVSLAPIAFMNHMTSPLLRIMAQQEKALEVLLGMIGVNEFLPSEGFIARISENICSLGVGPILCENVLFALCGFSPNQMNTTLTPLIMTHTPAGASTKQLLHYAQEVQSGKFRQYDLGLLGNIREYHSLWPPKYDLSKVRSPTYLIYSKNDWLAAMEDVDRLAHDLGNCKGKFLLSDYMFNHLDYVYGVDAPTLVNSKIVSLFSRHS